MILNNYWEWQRQKETGRTQNSYNPNLGCVNTYIKNVSGDNIRALFLWSNNSYSSSSNWGDYLNFLYYNYIINTNWGFTVSSSENETTIDDYDVDSVLTHSDNNIQYALQNVDDTLRQIVTCSGSNNSNGTVTIRKIGIWKKFYEYLPTNVMGLGKNCYLVIVDLEEPIEVPAGKGFTIVVDMTEQ